MPAGDRRRRQDQREQLYEGECAGRCGVTGRRSQQQGSEWRNGERARRPRQKVISCNSPPHWYIDSLEFPNSQESVSRSLTGCIQNLQEGSTGHKDHHRSAEPAPQGGKAACLPRESGQGRRWGSGKSAYAVSDEQGHPHGKGTLLPQ